MTDEQLDAFITAGTALLDLPVRPEWRASIRMHLAISMTHAQTVLAFQLADDCDPAPVFAA